MVLATRNKVLIEPLQDKLNLKRQSARAYASQIRKLHTLMNVPGSLTFEFLDSDKAGKRVADIINVGQRKNMASAALAGTRAAEMSLVRQNKYRKVMMDADADYKQWASSGVRNKGFTGKADQLWKMVKSLHKKVGRVVSAKNLFRRSTHTFPDLVVLQHFVYCKLLHHFEPRRLEYSSLRFLTPTQLATFSSAEQKTMNYILTTTRGKWKLVYNSYKTARTYGQQVYDIPPGFKTTLKKIQRIFAERVPAGWVFFARNGKPMTHSSFSKFIKDLFKTYVGKPWTQNTIRSIRVSALFKHAAPAKEIIEAQAGMGSKMSTMNLHYRVPQS